jgi:hypothetical protein
MTRNLYVGSSLTRASQATSPSGVPGCGLDHLHERPGDRLPCAGYDVVRQQEELDLEAPAGAPYFRDIRLTSRDVILARRGEVEVHGATSANFAAASTIPSVLGPFTLKAFCVAATHGFGELLDDPSSEAFDTRIDHVLTRGAEAPASKARLTGLDADNRTPSGLWPSDTPA